MKPLYLLLILYALFITGFGDALEIAFTAILPGVGIVIGMPLAMVINVTMGAGLVFLLAQNDMFHPKLGPAGIVAGVLPVIDSLPIWFGLVIAGILYKTAAEKGGIIGALAKTVTSAGSISVSNPVAAVKSARTVVQDNQKQRVNTSAVEATPRAPLNLKSPRMADIKPYVQKAA